MQGPGLVSRSCIKLAATSEILAERQRASCITPSSSWFVLIFLRSLYCRLLTACRRATIKMKKLWPTLFQCRISTSPEIPFALHGEFPPLLLSHRPSCPRQCSTEMPMPRVLISKRHLIPRRDMARVFLLKL